MKNKDAVIQKTLAAIEKHKMFSENDRVLVAVSGGADSVCLLDALCSLKDDLKLKIGIAHLHHGLRGTEADRDAEFVAGLAKKYHCEYFEKRINVMDLANEKKVSVETAGREARYHFFLELARKENFQKIATAHNQNDLAETVIMRLIRGTGIDGLCGISAKLENLIVRPVLTVSRNEIEAYCGEHGLKYCTDHTNAENVFTRNKIRNCILPLMTEINSGAVANIAHTAANLREDAEFMNTYALRLYKTLNNPHPSHKPTLLHIESVLMVGMAVRVRLFMIAAGEVMGDNYSLEQKHLCSISDLCGKETGAKLSLPGGLVVAVKYGWLEFSNFLSKKKIYFSDEEIEISPDNEYVFSEIGKKVTLTERSKQKNEKIISDKTRFIFDADLISEKKLFIRKRKRGDKITVFPDGKQKSIHRLMIDMKIPNELRDEIPVITVGDEVIAVLGYRISEKYKAKKTSERVLVVCYESI